MIFPTDLKAGADVLHLYWTLEFPKVLAAGQTQIQLQCFTLVNNSTP